ncbi:hypothetical protein PGT21_024165 [Puccinia graminis f. sp. tritici]|uniref:Uncharacterized protein n=1 Tax=Puccinia graminis f. sp. tritici TaxID=56615 RepID=A0A5B0M7X6_PUCGR|nr:hypothetical protein PGT21_009098 [Puccinia graminis f. sp. tritici]KAA1071964.1 hypothetical protein PGT21_024165 [Puccinia graminis f. sp. tritici]
MSVPSRKEVTANDAADGLFTVFEENFLLTAVTAIEAADRLFTEVELNELFGVEAAQESFEEVTAIEAEDRLSLFTELEHKELFGAEAAQDSIEEEDRLFTELELKQLFGTEAAQDYIEEAIEAEDRLFTELELKELFGMEAAQYLIQEGYITRGNMEHIHNTLSNKYGFSGPLKIDYIETPEGQVVSSNVLFRPMLQEWMRSDPPFDNVEHYFPDYVAFRSMDHDVDNTGGELAALHSDKDDRLIA